MQQIQIASDGGFQRGARQQDHVIAPGFAGSRRQPGRSHPCGQNTALPPGRRALKFG
jgi:hypothetical protein